KRIGSLIAGFDSIFEVQRTLYANAVQALNELQTGGAGALPSLAAAAFTFGMLHALLPGHGKSVLASYYAADGRWRGALGSSLIPCPLTFIMTYATVHGAIKWGLLLSALFAVGMTFTVAVFPLTAVLARTGLLPLIARTEAIRNRVASEVEVCAAIAVIAIGA